MRTVVYVAPFPLQTTLRFGRALRSLPGVRVVGLFQQPPGPGGPFHDMVQVADVFDPQQIVDGVRQVVAKYGGVHCVLGILENLQEAIAEARAALGLPGTDLATTRRFRDKGLMKDALRAAGIPVARHARLTHPDQAQAFVEQVGFPIVLKPPAGAGAKATLRAHDPASLRQALAQLQPSPGNEVLAEEFLQGTEHSYETLTLDGQVCFSSIGRYLPPPLQVVEHDWIQWVVLLPRHIDTPEFADIHALAPKVIQALGLRTGITHMEWFRRPDGSLAIGEIAQRPPGAKIVDLMGWAHDHDLYQAWARLMVMGQAPPPLARRFATAAAFLRGTGTGRVVAIEGLEEAQRRMGAVVVDKQLPKIGQPKSDGYEGEGWVILRHPDTAVVEAAVKILIETVRVRYA